mmetsp:Transcript_113006/g.365154  ORF Transcript_113006/g.365154 Transcript_113006/m.365154 type:complete len:464 (+) Transcript_113006:258-1649(+)
MGRLPLSSRLGRFGPWHVVSDARDEIKNRVQRLVLHAPQNGRGGDGDADSQRARWLQLLPELRQAPEGGLGGGVHRRGGLGRPLREGLLLNHTPHRLAEILRGATLVHLNTSLPILAHDVGPLVLIHVEWAADHWNATSQGLCGAVRSHVGDEGADTLALEDVCLRHEAHDAPAARREVRGQVLLQSLIRQGPEHPERTSIESLQQQLHQLLVGPYDSAEGNVHDGILVLGAVKPLLQLGGHGRRLGLEGGLVPLQLVPVALRKRQERSCVDVPGSGLLTHERLCAWKKRKTLSQLIGFLHHLQRRLEIQTQKLGQRLAQKRGNFRIHLHGLQQANESQLHSRIHRCRLPLIHGLKSGQRHAHCFRKRSQITAHVDRQSRKRANGVLVRCVNGAKFFCSLLSLDLSKAWGLHPNILDALHLTKPGAQVVKRTCSIANDHMRLDLPDQAQAKLEVLGEWLLPLR